MRTWTVRIGILLVGPTSFEATAETLHRGIRKRLAETSLGTDRRVAFYPVGAAEAQLLDHVAPNWHRRYWTDKFDLGAYYK